MNRGKREHASGFDKEEIKSFLDWVSTATDIELDERKQALIALLDRLHDKDVRADVRWCIRRIDCEISARFELNGVTKKGA